MYFNPGLVLSYKIVNSDKTFIVYIHIIKDSVHSSCFTPRIHLQSFSLDFNMPLKCPRGQILIAFLTT
jgi:hypothetical protein